MNNTIDITKKYRTRDGRAVTGLHLNEDTSSRFALAGIVHEEDGRSDRETWTETGVYLPGDPCDRYDLVLAEDQEPEKPVPGLLTPDPLKVEYGAFVAAVRANFAAGTFATATQEQFDAWLESLTPILRA